MAQGSDPDTVARLEELIMREEAGNWATSRADRCDFAVLRVEARQQHSWLQQRGQGSGVPRLAYLLNPLMPCASPLMGGRWVSHLADLLPALEETAGRVDRRLTEPIDAHVAAFVSARLERRMDKELSAQNGGVPRGLPVWRSFACLRSCSRGCTRGRCLPWPPGWRREPGQCWHPGGIANVAPRWRNDCRR